MTTATNRKRSKWLCLSPSLGQSIGRLFCLPYAGGGAAAYYPWIGRIPPGIDLVRILLPGRETRLREPLFSRLEPLVATLVEELIPWIERPFAVYGHSIGTLLAFELVRELRRRYKVLPTHLFVSGYRAPHLPPFEAPISHLPDADFIGRVRQYGGIPDPVAKNQELMEIFLPILRADFEISETYVYREESPLECPISAFGGLADPKITCDKINAWSLHTSMLFSSHLFPGGHFFIQDSEPLVLERINHELMESLLTRS